MAINKILGIDLNYNQLNAVGKINGQPLKEQSKEPTTQIGSPVNFGGLTTGAKRAGTSGFSEVVKNNPLFRADANPDGKSYQNPMQNYFCGVGGVTTGREVTHNGKIGYLANDFEALA